MDAKKFLEKRESEKIEFKKSLAVRREMLKVISAFANKHGGTIFVGVEENKNGTIRRIVGINVGGKTIEKLANEIKQNTDPIIYPSIKMKKIQGKSIMAIKVSESSVKPVFAKIDKIPVAFKRVGKTNQKIDVNELRRIISEGKEFLWDSQICKKTTLEDIDWKFVEENFIPLYETISEKKVISDPRNLLESLECIKKNKPTNAGILLFGKKPQKFFMNSYIALARYKEKEIGAERLDYKEFNGNLFRQIDSCNRYIREHTDVMSRLILGEIRRQDIPEYGFFSIRELITNAICHRDYFNQNTKVIVKMFPNRIL